ncbi:Smc5-Smc6 complex subunit [Saccharomycopsis crataegensis]|uniref:Smc5-Smc6 complex subunit n=1 Tax=Saccharomycopsis crataegensis TaxID=43959 RepID=A0AAV5QU82_9ASCO|nr:Smc5-Smc6 complex subunit [Saccharomycopsis crataegensis]
MARTSGKRAYEDDQGEEYHDYDGEARSEETTPSAPPNVQNMAYKMVRGVFALEFRKNIINKNQLQKVVWENESYREVKFDKVFELCQQSLETIYGFKLVELPQKEIDIGKRKLAGNNNSNANESKKSSGVKAWILVSVLSEDAKKLLGQFWEKASIKYFKQVDSLGSISENKNLPLNESTLCNNALTMIVIACVALSSNNMNKVELLKYLKHHFDISLTSTIPNISHNNEKVNLEDFLKMMEKTEYLSKKVEHNEEHELIEYSLGRRAKVEFPKESLCQFVQKMYNYEQDDEKNEQLRNQVELSVGQAYT